MYLILKLNVLLMFTINKYLQNKSRKKHNLFDFFAEKNQ